MYNREVVRLIDLRVQSLTKTALWYSWQVYLHITASSLGFFFFFFKLRYMHNHVYFSLIPGQMMQFPLISQF